MHNIIHDRGEAVCSISAASIFNDVDFFFPAELKKKPKNKSGHERGEGAVLSSPCR